MSAAIAISPTTTTTTTTTAATDARPRRRGGGPRTPEGKDRSRRNALKHGLRARVVLPEGFADAVAERSREFAAQLVPQSSLEQFLVAQVAFHSVKLDRLAAAAPLDLRRRSERAALCWEDDRRRVAEELGSKLPRDPARVSQALAGTRHGAHWLIERWERLAEAARRQGGWDEAQTRLAHDLLGSPPGLRRSLPDVPERPTDEDLASLALAQAGRLRRRLESLSRLDDSEREMASWGMPMDEDGPSARLRRYESESRRALYRALSEFRRLREPAAEPLPQAGSSRPAPRPHPATADPAFTIPRLHASLDATRERSEAAARTNSAAARTNSGGSGEDTPDPLEDVVLQEIKGLMEAEERGELPAGRTFEELARERILRLLDEEAAAGSTPSATPSSAPAPTGNRHQRRRRAKLARQADRRGR